MHRRERPIRPLAPVGRNHLKWPDRWPGQSGGGLADYGNVASSQTAQLPLVGVAQKDAAGYSVVVAHSAGESHSRSDLNEPSPSPFIVSIDGAYLGRFVAPHGDQTNALVHGWNFGINFSNGHSKTFPMRTAVAKSM